MVDVFLARFFVGVHYPFDVMAGALLGLAIGLGVGRLMGLMG